MRILPISIVLRESSRDIYWASHTDHVFCVTPRLSFSLKLMWTVKTLNRTLTPHCPESMLCPQEDSWELASDAASLWVAECCLCWACRTRGVRLTRGLRHLPPAPESGARPVSSSPKRGCGTRPSRVVSDDVCVFALWSVERSRNTCFLFRGCFSVPRVKSNCSECWLSVRLSWPPDFSNQGKYMVVDLKSKDE